MLTTALSLLLSPLSVSLHLLPPLPRQARLYFDYARDSTLVSTLLSDPSGRATILAPTDSAILALSRRPHQGPLPVVPGSLVGAGGAGGVSSNEEERSAAEWLERWVKGHVVLEEVRLEGEGWEEREYETMEGRKVRFEGSGEGGEGRRLVAEGIEVVGEEQVRFSFFRFLATLQSADGVSRIGQQRQDHLHRWDAVPRLVCCHPCVQLFLFSSCCSFFSRPLVPAQLSSYYVH